MEAEMLPLDFVGIEGIQTKVKDYFPIWIGFTALMRFI
jgi:hypothetical protein